VNDSEATNAISRICTRQNTFTQEEQGRLINEGFARADAALRSRFDVASAEPLGLPEADYLV
jgi:hypothetical protein